MALIWFPTNLYYASARETNAMSTVVDLYYAGERRIRVHTLCLPITNSVSDVITGADQQAIAGLLAKMGKISFWSIEMTAQMLSAT